MPSSATGAPLPVVPSASGSAGVIELEGFGPVDLKVVQDHLKVQTLIRAYQVRGHSIANLDPLGIYDADLDPSIPPELTLEHYGFSEKDMSRQFALGLIGFKGFFEVDAVCRAAPTARTPAFRLSPTPSRPGA